MNLQILGGSLAEIWLVNSSFREWVWVTCELRCGDFVGEVPS
jgi:hypothetical protein